MATPLTSGGFGDLLEPGLAKVFHDRVKEIPQMVPTLFGMGTEATSYYKTSSVGAFGDFTDFDTSGTVVYDDFAQGYDVKIEFKQFVSGFQIARKLYDDELNIDSFDENRRARNLAICWDEPKASFTDEVIIKEMEQCVNQQERLSMIGV